MNRVLSIAAVLLAAAALIVSLTHRGPAGPSGPRGPVGPAGRSASAAHLGVCVNLAYQTGAMYLSGNAAAAVTSPVLTDGVATCPSGSFVSIVPQK